MHEERRDLDFAEELSRVILIVVVRRIGKAISRSDDVLVKFENCSDAVKCRLFVRTDSAWRREHFFFHVVEKVRMVEAVARVQESKRRSF